MGRNRLRGFLDPLFEDAGETVAGLAAYLEVSRQTINRWQKKPAMISEIHRMRINLLFIAKGLTPPFAAIDQQAVKEAIRGGDQKDVAPHPKLG